MLRAALDDAQAKANEGGFELEEGRRLTLHVAHAGVGLVVSKISRVTMTDGLVRARTERGELFVLAVADVFAAGVEGTKSPSGQTRKAGFLG